MRLSLETLELFKIISQVNSYIVLKENSNFIRVINDQMNFFIEVYTKETFPETAVFDLNKFLGIISTLGDLDSIDVEFTSKSIELKSGNRNSSLVLIDPKMVQYFQYVDKPMNLPEVYAASFVLTKDVLKELKKASNILSLEFLAIRFKDNQITLSLEDMKKTNYSNPTTDTYTVSLEGRTMNQEGECFVNLQNFNSIYLSDYTVFLFNFNDKYKIKLDCMDQYQLNYYLGALVR